MRVDVELFSKHLRKNVDEETLFNLSETLEMFPLFLQSC